MSPFALLKRDPVVADEEVVQLHVTMSDVAAVEVIDA